MSAFTEQEIEYLRSQRLGRIATAGPDGQPHVVPVSFRYNAEQDSIDIGGHAFATRKKYRDVLANPRVARTSRYFLAVENAWATMLMQIGREHVRTRVTQRSLMHSSTCKKRY